ncbi:MAG: beta-N-acetylhexosaminidase [Thalassotalea sp.]|nr:beta-N-acetylhexosaminidase [Thalassotalea sp.]MDG2392202.1 beta-N-acetylhexosaminidase [Thalassotalea sp.]
MSALMIDVLGTNLTAEDREVIAHPKVGGLILFSRNYQEPKQLTELVKQMRAVKPDILIAVDQEGGRVQRFRESFSKLPAMGSIYKHAKKQNNNPKTVLEQAKFISQKMGYLMALEVQSVGIDISFAPVLDIDDISDVIGDRGFHKEPEIVTALASSFIDGMHQVGMKSTGKHFPGHGSVKEDSHIAMPVDNRSKESIFEHDMSVFKSLIKSNHVDALMPAHVIYPQVDSLPVGFSPYWLQTILRGELGFQGVIFSDDLSMQGATSAGGYAERCEAAYDAGCDMLLVCNDRDGAVTAIDKANLALNKVSEQRVKKLLGQPQITFEQLASNPNWQQCQNLLFS